MFIRRNFRNGVFYEKKEVASEKVQNVAHVIA